MYEAIVDGDFTDWTPAAPTLHFLLARSAFAGETNLKCLALLLEGPISFGMEKTDAFVGF